MVRKSGERVTEFARRLRQDYPDVRVMLFGSRAGMDFMENSDFDVLVVSRGFEGTGFFDRPVKMYDYWESGALDVFCYTPDEFEAAKNRIGFVSEALKKAQEM